MERRGGSVLRACCLVAAAHLIAKSISSDDNFVLYAGACFALGLYFHLSGPKG